MEIEILNKQFETIAIIDAYESFIWADRYNGYGDFELYTGVNKEILKILEIGNYVWFYKSEHLMVIDERSIASDIERSDLLTVKGRSLEWLLERRIIWNQTILTGNFQNGILKLLNENVINPNQSNRPNAKIPNFIFQASTDPAITSLTIDTQFTGDNLYLAIEKLCKERNVGFKIILNENNQFVFSLYAGTDRSFQQTTNPYVIFSPDYDNIINSEYLESGRIMKTAALIAGEGEGLDRRTTTINNAGAGLERREVYIDAREISSNVEGGTMPPNQYIEQLRQKGQREMKQYIFVKSFVGDVETTKMFVFGKDFFLGDIVQLVNEYEIEAGSRIDEIVFSFDDTSGETTVPTFSIIQ